MIDLAPEVEEALRCGGAVVALESTIIAHGLPYPDNLALAKRLEETVREHGATPATIAVIGGRAKVGLSASQLEELAAGTTPFEKAGAADLAVAFANTSNAATTVSATSTLAAHAGIAVFATGGIGGVHRGDDYDVSADLLSLSRLPVAVVSAGPKAILDVATSAEVLETLGVLVLGYGTDELPAFYCRTSGIPLAHRVNSPELVADILRHRWHLLQQGGVLVANPVPLEHALERDLVEGWIRSAHREATVAGITGKALTPFLLQRMAVLSNGTAVETNCALAVNNAKVAAQIAVAL